MAHNHTRACLTNQEVRDLEQDYGTKKQRIGKESQRPWNHCCLTLSALTEQDDAVVSPYGHLFRREAILECLLSQVKRQKKQAREERVREGEVAMKEKMEKKRQRSEEIKAFVANESGFDKLHVVGDGGGDNYVVEDEEKKKKKKKNSKVEVMTLCPESNLPLRLNDLHFVRVVSHCSSCLRSGDTKQMCALIPQGTLVCIDCATQVEGKDPSSGKPCKVIQLRKGGSGYAANTDQVVVAIKKRPAFQIG